MTVGTGQVAAQALTVEPLVHPGSQLERVELGAWTEVGPHCRFENVRLGDYSYAGEYCVFQNASIAKFANIASSVRIGPTRHPMDRPTQHHFTYRPRLYGFADRDDEAFFAWRQEQLVTIGNDTWIGHGAIVMPGVAVGDGAVIGAGAVVTRDVAPYVIAVGSPARAIRRRFDDALAAGLLRIRWWDWPHEVIRERLEDFCGSAEGFVGKYGG